MSAENIVIPGFIIFIITMIALGFYLTVGGVYLIVFGISAQFIGFFVLLFAQRTVRVKREEFDKLLDEKFNGMPYLQVGHNQWRFFWGWIIVSIGLISQMIGLFLPETGLMFQKSQSVIIA